VRKASWHCRLRDGWPVGSNVDDLTISAPLGMKSVKRDAWAGRRTCDHREGHVRPGVAFGGRDERDGEMGWPCPSPPLAGMTA
jgi:hypothetical protein